MSNRTVRLAIACVASVVLCPTSQAAAQNDRGAVPRQLVTALHVHSTASSGDETLEQLVRRAADSGIDGIVLNENFAFELRYAPAILRLFVEVRVTAPTLENYGIGRYLAEVQQARSASQEILVLAGAEVPPHYYWSGSLLRGDLTLHEMQRNLLILPPVAGRSNDDAKQFLTDLPALGNRYQRRFGWRSLGLLLPGLVLIAMPLLRIQRRGPDERRPVSPSWLLGALTGLILLWVNFPFTVPQSTAYETATGLDPAQRLIDYTRRHGGLVFWSMPEAADERIGTLGPLSVRMSTSPYPDALATSTGYTGFGGVYADTTRVWEAGGIWDAELLSHLANERRRVPWLVGESAYHSAGHAGKQLGDVLTVLLVEEASEITFFRALETGRGYAVRRDQDGADLRLLEFAAISGGRANGDDVARLGDTLRLAPGTDAFELVLEVGDARDVSSPVQLEVVRNGVVTRRVEGTTPLRQRWREVLPAEIDAAFYRVVVRGRRPAHLVTNPIFVRRDGAAR